jgi:hypothetical protein
MPPTSVLDVYPCLKSFAHNGAEIPRYYKGKLRADSVKASSIKDLWS